MVFLNDDFFENIMNHIETCLSEDVSKSDKSRKGVKRKNRCLSGRCRRIQAYSDMRTYIISSWKS